MKRAFLTFLLTAALCISMSGCNAVSEHSKINAPISITQQATASQDIVVYIGVSSEPEYDADVDYMSLMIRRAVYGDMDALAGAVAARNEKIVALNLNDKILSTDEFLLYFEQYAGFALYKDYLAEMKTCCFTGDVEGGRKAEICRNRKLEVLQRPDLQISFDNLYLLSKVIMSEAGSSWLSTQWKMAVGEVLLNRINSPEFPDTMEDCVYQDGQYRGTRSTRFQNLIPDENCTEAALRLLKGERVLNEPTAVFQSSKIQGSGVCLELYDKILGTTYICYSANPKLYWR